MWNILKFTARHITLRSWTMITFLPSCLKLEGEGREISSIHISSLSFDDCVALSLLWKSVSLHAGLEDLSDQSSKATFRFIQNCLCCSGSYWSKKVRFASVTAPWETMNSSFSLFEACRGRNVAHILNEAQGHCGSFLCITMHVAGSGGEGGSLSLRWILKRLIAPPEGIPLHTILPRARTEPSKGRKEQEDGTRPSLEKMKFQLFLALAMHFLASSGAMPADLLKF